MVKDQTSLVLSFMVLFLVDLFDFSKRFYFYSIVVKFFIIYFLIYIELFDIRKESFIFGNKLFI